jgi:hypothetical protein
MQATENYTRKDHAVVYTRGKERFYAVKTRGENFEMIDTPEPRCIMTEYDARQLFNKIINKRQWTGVELVKVC